MERDQRRKRSTAPGELEASRSSPAEADGRCFAPIYLRLRHHCIEGRSCLRTPFSTVRAERLHSRAHARNITVHASLAVRIRRECHVSQTRQASGTLARTLMQPERIRKNENARTRSALGFIPERLADELRRSVGVFNLLTLHVLTRAAVKSRS